MDRRELLGLCSAATDTAVARMIHRTDPDRVHAGFGVGACPLCSPLENAWVRTGIRERMREIMARCGGGTSPIR